MVISILLVFVWCSCDPDLQVSLDAGVGLDSHGEEQRSPARSPNQGGEQAHKPPCMAGITIYSSLYRYDYNSLSLFLRLSGSFFLFLSSLLVMSQMYAEKESRVHFPQTS